MKPSKKIINQTIKKGQNISKVTIHRKLKLKSKQLPNNQKKNPSVLVEMSLRDFQNMQNKQNIGQTFRNLQELYENDKTCNYKNKLLTPPKTIRVSEISKEQNNQSKYQNQHEIQYKNWKIQDFEILKTMGRGKFGTVYAAQQKISQYIVAIKQMNKNQLKLNNFQSQIQRQIEIQKSLNHNHILKIYGYFWDDQNIYIVLQYAPGGQLLNFLKLYGYFCEQKVSCIIREVCYGLRELHANSIIHRDIKPENLLVSCDGVKLADFGWSVQSNTRRQTLCGTLDYLAPEIVQGSTHDQSIDIWQIGILTYELAVGRPPFETNSFKQTYKKILQNEVKFPFHISFQLRQFIRTILQTQPKNRPTIQKILNSPFIQKYKKYKHNLLQN